MSNKNKLLVIAGALIIALLSFMIGQFTASKTIKIEDKFASSNQSNTSKTNLSNQSISTNKVTSNTNMSNNIPSHVLEIMEYVLEHKSAPDGYVGGRKFMNREQLRTKHDDDGNKYSYQEWDVNPKTNGRNRGSERIVTSDQNDCYYTNDHYRSFTKIN